MSVSGQAASQRLHPRQTNASSSSCPPPLLSWGHVSPCLPHQPASSPHCVDVQHPGVVVEGEEGHALQQVGRCRSAHLQVAAWGE